MPALRPFPQEVLILGPGFLGLTAAREIQEKGSRVRTLTRGSTKARELEKLGFGPLTGDLASDELPPFPPVEAVLFCAAPDGHAEADYRALYLDGLSRALGRLDARSLRLFIYVSSTSVYGQEEGELDEKSIPEPLSEKARILLEAERRVLESGLPASVLRLTGIYGPGRSRLGSPSSMSPAREPGRLANMIYRDDAAAALITMLGRAAAGEIYLGTDDFPAANGEITAWIEALKKGTAPPEVSGRGRGRRFSNARLKSLGWHLSYPSFREGYQTLWRMCQEAEA